MMHMRIRLRWCVLALGLGLGGVALWAVRAARQDSDARPPSPSALAHVVTARPSAPREEGALNPPQSVRTSPMVGAGPAPAHDAVASLAAAAAAAWATVGVSVETEAAIGAIVAHGDKAVAALAEALRQRQDMALRQVAAYALCQIGTERALDAYLQGILHEGDLEALDALLRALQLLGNPERCPALLQALTRTQNPDVVEALGAAAAALMDRAGMEWLARLWRSGAVRESWQQQNLLAVMSRVEAPDTLPVVVGLLSGDVGDPLRAAAVTVLRQLDFPAVEEEDLRQDWRELLRTALTACEPADAGTAVAAALARLGTLEEVETLRRLCRHDDWQAWQRRNLLEAIAIQHDPALVPVLRGALLYETAEDVTSAAARALALVDNGPAARALVEAIETSTADLADTHPFCQALLRMQTDEALAVLARAGRTTQSASLQRVAETALARLDAASRGVILDAAATPLRGM